MAPWDSIGVSSFSSLSSVRFISFDCRRDMSQSRNPKLLNYFPIVVAVDHVCSNSESIRISFQVYSRHYQSGALPNRADRKMRAIAFLEKSRSRDIAI